MAYAIYYFKDNTVEVGKITCMNEEDQKEISSTTISQCPNLEEDGGWINVTWRGGNKKKGSSSCFPAKVLMLGDNYTDLCQKRENFINGEDIWRKMEDEKGGKRKIKPNSKWLDNEDENEMQSKKQKTKTAPCPAREAANRMIQELKKDLMGQQKRLESTMEYEDSSDDEQLPRTLSREQQQIQELIAENQRLKENVKPILEAMRELPAVVQQFKEIAAQLATTLSHDSNGSTPVHTPLRSPMRSQPLASAPASPQMENTEMVSLVSGSDVKVPRQKLNTLKTLNASVYIGDLAVLVYGRETLSCSSLTGRQSGAHKEVESKPQLDGTKLDAIIGHALVKFPGTSVQDVRRIIRKKCNNESYKQAAAQKNIYI